MTSRSAPGLARQLLKRPWRWTRFAGAAAAALVVACSPSPEGSDSDGNAARAAPDSTMRPPAETEGPAPDQADLTVLVREDGLLVETPGHARPLTFGATTPRDAEAALASLGPPKRSFNAECPAGPLDFMEWDNGLQLAFQDGKLAGWWASDRARGIATARGLRPGSPRSAVGSAPVEDTSVGKLFTVDGVNGLLDDGPGTGVSALWAGAACIFH